MYFHCVLTRVTASTMMNDVSSRSHAIFTVTFTQVKLGTLEVYLETHTSRHLIWSAVYYIDLYPLLRTKSNSSKLLMKSTVVWVNVYSKLLGPVKVN